MADTIRKQMIDSLVTHLKGEAWIISAGVGVNPGKTHYQVAELPALSIIAGQEQGLKVSSGVQDYSLEIEIRYYAVIDEDIAGPFEVSEDIRGKIIKSVGIADLDDLANDLIYSGGDVYYPDAKDASLQVVVLFNIEYLTLLNNPYSQGD